MARSNIDSQQLVGSGIIDSQQANRPLGGPPAEARAGYSERDAFYRPPGDIDAPPGYGGTRVLNDLMDHRIRNGFVRKVYGILCVQMLLTVLIALPFHLVPAVSEFVRDYPPLLWTALALTVLFSCILTCFPQAGRSVPCNYILLFAFTIVEAFLIGVITAMHETWIVLAALCITSGICVGLTIFASITKADFTGMGVYLIAFVLATVGVGIVALIIQSEILHMVYLWLGLIVFSGMFVYDTQLMLGGKHRQHALNVDDYVFAALSLYLDMINIFLYILQILDGGRK